MTYEGNSVDGRHYWLTPPDAVLFIDLYETERAEVAKQQATGMRAP